ncbi:MAG: hypothetical protein J6Y57_07615, partial [Lachnospiraceae bacterium]|nr:hypothetical protein [Lachnospiraceae bacterium]
LYRFMLEEALSAAKTNRTLFSHEMTDFWDMFKGYLQNGQYHSTGLHGLIILPILVVMTIWLLCYCFKFRMRLNEETKKYFFIITTGWVLWITSAFVEAFQESGFRVGITLIDGFQWGRLVGFMRPMWYIMIVAFACFKPKERLFRNNLIGLLFGAGITTVVWYGLRFLLGQNTTPTVLFNSEFETAAQIIVFVTGAALFLSWDTCRYYGMLVLLCTQLIYVGMADTQYNDTGKTLSMKLMHDETDASITLNEFYSNTFFERIKKDIDYDGELVAAYGFHPSVLMYNGFETIDRYESVHSMKMQNEFREIIAPALERYPYWRDYYDTWGGRMYLYGECDFSPTRVKTTESKQLYIDTNAFKKYGGSYIFSRAVVNNAEETGLHLLRDYDDKDGIYHIFLYTVE